MPACVVDPREPTCRPWALSVARCCLETGLRQPRRLRAPLSQPCRSEGAADGANGASAPDTSRGPTPPGRLGAQPPRRRASSVGHQPGSLPPPRCQRVCWAPGPGRPSERSCSGRGPGSLPPSRNSSCRLRGGGRGFAGLSPRFAVAGSAGLQPGSSRCLSPGSQSFGHGGSFSLTRRGGWERPEIETPSPGGVSRSPVPAAAASVEEDLSVVALPRLGSCFPVSGAPLGSADGWWGLDRGRNRLPEEARPLWGREHRCPSVPGL